MSRSASPSTHAAIVYCPGVPVAAGIVQAFSLGLDALQTRLYAVDTNQRHIAVLMLDANGDVIGPAPGSPLSTDGGNPENIAVR